MSGHSSKWKTNKRYFIFVVSMEIFEQYHGKYILRKVTKTLQNGKAHKKTFI